MASWRTGLWVVICLGLATAPAAADYPERPLVVVVAFDRGGATDATARQLAPFLARHLGPDAQVEVVNRPGASGEVGFAAIADAVPDGYTIGFINLPNVVAIPIERAARYSLARLDPLVNVVDDPGIWMVRADSPYTSLSSVLAAARARPGAVVVGSTGVGSDGHLGLQMVERLSGVRFRHQSFPGSAAARRALLDGRIAVCGDTLAEGVWGRQRGTTRLLGVMAAQRWPVAPEVPSFAEQGIAVAMSSHRGLAAPQGLPAPVRARLVGALLAALSDPRYLAQVAQPATYQPLKVMGPDGFAAELRRQDAALRRVWQHTPWAVD